MADRERPVRCRHGALFMRRDCVDVTALDMKSWYSMMHHDLIVLSPHLELGQPRLRMESAKRWRGSSAEGLPGSGGLQAKGENRGFWRNCPGNQMKLRAINGQVCGL
jgi:hypothetical protein